MEPNPKLVALFAEFDAPKTNLEPYQKLVTEFFKAIANWTKKGIIKDVHTWTDNTRHVIAFFLFETMEKFAELWDEPEFHRFVSESSMFVENLRIRLMRPAPAPE